uniref:Protein tyrosine phosphatase receptor type Q n=1 Tax=Cynoglossus semilaevis TaxID=244447 RepID=A0A3P8V0V9_CYNSE
DPVGSSGILLSWKMPDTTNVDYYVAAAYPSGIGPYSKALYIQTNESPPGQVTNLTAYVQNHTYAIVTWFLPHRINGLITKFAIKVKHTRTAETVHEQEVNAGDIMSIALPHCNDAADILSRATLSPLEMTASAPPITLSAVPPAASWSVPISVGVDGLRPYTAYLFEVSAFTSDGEGQIASQMTRTPESAPEDSPQNFKVRNVTSRSISVSWNSPNIITGKFTYVLYIYGSTGSSYENSTADMQFTFTGLTPYMRYTVAVRAKSAGEVVAPSAVQELSAMAEDSVSILVSWKSPAQPNGPITQYRLQVFADDTLVQDITLTTGNITDSYQEWTAAPDVSNGPAGGRRKRSADLSAFTSPTAFIGTLSDRSLPTDSTMLSFKYTDDVTGTDREPTDLSYLVSELNPFTEYTFRVTASTTVGEGPVANVTEKTREQVPSSVLQVTYQNISSTSIQVNWVPPLNPNGQITHYTVYGLKLHNKQPLQWMSNTTNILITDLEKYTGYKLRVAASTAAGESSLSEEDDIFVFTLEDEPDSPPYNLTVLETSPSTVTLTWSAPERANGDIKQYEVLYGNESYSAVLNSSANAATLTGLRPFSYYNVSVRAYTRYGHGNQTSDILYLLSGEDGKFMDVYVCRSPHIKYVVYISFKISVRVHHHVFLTISPSEVNVTWEPPLLPNGVIVHYSLELWNSSHLINLTSPANYIHITHLRKFAQYWATVQAHTRAGPGNSSDLLNITTLEDVPLDPPQNVSVINMTISSITLRWKSPTEPRGIVTHYTIYYMTDTTVTEQVRQTSWQRWLGSGDGSGPGSGRLQFRVHQLPIPSGSVQNLTAAIYSSTTVVVSWDPPLEPNGQPYYLITLQEAGVPPDISGQGTPAANKTIKQTTTDNVVLFTKLRKYFPYVVTVIPATSAGAAYNHTSTLNLRTDEDMLVSTTNLSSSSIAVVWQRPLEANGEITEYTVNLSGPGGSNSSQTSSNSVIFTNLLPYTPYNLTITAATRKGSGHQGLLLQLHTDEDEPMSPPRNLMIYNYTAVSVWLRWEPPLQPSGVILQYSFRVRDLITHSVTYQNSSDPSTTAYLSGFRPHSSYEISVYSYTSVGHGNQFSRPVTFTTNESVSDPIGNLSCSGLSWDSIFLSWEVPANPNGQIVYYEITVGIGLEFFEYQSPSTEHVVTGLLPDNWYTLTVSAVNSAGPGDKVNCSASTLSESGMIIFHLHLADPDDPPRNLKVTPTSRSFHIAWDAPTVLSGPTSYLVFPLVLHFIFSFSHFVQPPSLIFCRFRELFSALLLLLEPKNPPTNVVILIIPEEVNRVRVTFTPPDEPYGNITAYFVHVYEKQQLVKNDSLIIARGENSTLTAVIEGLKGGKNYSIQVRRYDAPLSQFGMSPPSSDVQISTDIKAPAKPYQIPQVQLTPGGVAMVTHRTITIRLPACFYNDDNGPIVKIQVIVAESGDVQNVTVWKNAFLGHPAPYLTDEGFPNPVCLFEDDMTYVIGENDSCVKENNTRHFCNGPLKPNTAYVFKFRATNTKGQYTDSEYSDHIRTKDEGLLTRDEQIILGVLLSFFLAVLLITIICVAHKMDGGTYSPREVEIIDAKYKLDQLAAVADLEVKQEKINRPISKKSFLQHVEDLCANDNAKFQEEFAALPKLLQDLATTDADLPWNKSKNRFPNIRPYNNNRVKLLSEPGTAGSDYINASFVSGYLCPNEFIATQGPLPGTVADFWRMIWETGTRTVAMLTQCFEKGKIRCHKYWPEDNKPMSVFSDILISKVSEEVFPDWSVRTLKVEKHGHYILVRHFNYTSWPEHGVPESCNTFIKFVKAVRANRHDNNTTIAVHCRYCTVIVALKILLEWEETTM